MLTAVTTHVNFAHPRCESTQDTLGLVNALAANLGRMVGFCHQKLAKEVVEDLHLILPRPPSKHGLGANR